jgi:hypothetical protein
LSAAWSACGTERDDGGSDGNPVNLRMVVLPIGGGQWRLSSYSGTPLSAYTEMWSDESSEASRKVSLTHDFAEPPIHVLTRAELGLSPSVPEQRVRADPWARKGDEDTGYR